MWDFGAFLQPETWVSLLTLTFLEIVLGVDNIIFISIAAGRLPQSEQKKAVRIGLIIAMVLRILLLFGISYIISLNKPFMHFDLKFINGSLSGQSIILFLGGIFLMYKSTSEIHHKLEGSSNEEQEAEDSKNSFFKGLTGAVIQICLINIVFSIDSILTAIGLTQILPVMLVAVILSILVMMMFANPVGKFVNDHPSVQMLGLSFLILIGFMLVAEAGHLGHIELFGQGVGSIPKSYLYFAIFFSLGVEMLNMRLRKKSKPVELKQQYQQEDFEEIV